jgi:hypothetical protein
MTDASQAIARLRELREGQLAKELHKRFMACATLPGREDYGVWPEWAQDPRNWPYLRHVTSSTPAIVAAMNSLPALLECAEALEAAEVALVNCVPTVSEDQMPEPGRGALHKIRLALQALAEGGGE